MKCVLVEREPPGLLAHPLEPGADRWELRQLMARVGRQVRVREERDVGDRVCVAHEPRSLGQMPLEHLQRRHRPGLEVLEQRGVLLDAELLPAVTEAGSSDL